MTDHTDPQPKPASDARRQVLIPERKQRLREAWEEHWATPISQPVNLNWALEIRSNGHLFDAAESDATEPA